jgi:alpha-beta hydrolase superfamily lysophospholipase
MSSEAFINDLGGKPGLNVSGTEVANVAATAALAGAAAVARAGHKWNAWVKGGLIAFSALGGATALGVNAVSAFVGYKVVKPARRVLAEDATEELPREKVTFPSRDGRLNLSGYFYPTTDSRAAIILCHGFHGGAVDTHPAASIARESGYNTLTFDFRGCGESGGKTTSVGYWEVGDLLGAIDYLKSRPEVDPEKICVYGFSMGGAVAILAAEREPAIKAIITDAAFASLDALLSVKFNVFYRLPRFPFRYTAVWWSRWFSQTTGKKVDPLKALQKMAAESRGIPHFVIHGQSDDIIPVDNATLIYEKTPGPTKDLWLVPEAGHVAAGYFDQHAYMARVCEFLDPIMRK